MKRTWLFVIAGKLMTLALLGQRPATRPSQCSQANAAGNCGITLTSSDPLTLFGAIPRVFS